MKLALCLLVAISLAPAAVLAQPTPPNPTPAPTPEPTPPAPTPDPGPTPTTPPPEGEGEGAALAPAEPPAEPPKAEGPPALAVAYDKGLLFTTADEKFEARLALRSQFRLEISRPTEDGAELSSHFVIPRVRLQLEGHAFGKDTRYKMEAGLEERGNFAFVKDFFLEHQTGPVWIRAGQWKRPFNRQELVSDFGSVLNERAITAEFVGGGRDIGIAVHNDYEKSPEGVEWVVGVFNGFAGGADRPRFTTTCEADPVTGEIECTSSTPSNFPADFGPTVVARVGYNSGKVKGYTEGDLDGGGLRWGVGVNYKVDLANLSEGMESSVADNLSHGVGVDAIAKIQGFDVQVGAFLMKLKSADALLGAMVQAGYFVIPKKAQVAGRFAFHELPGTEVKELEARGAFNWYFSGHSWKLANDFGFLKSTGGGDPEIQVRLMAQLTF